MEGSGEIVKDGYRRHTVYIPVASPPTPVPSPRLLTGDAPNPNESESWSQILLTRPLSSVGGDTSHRRRLLLALLRSLPLSDLLFLSQTVALLLKRDLLSDLPSELALHVLSFVQEPRTLCRAMAVSKRWYALTRDEGVWRGLCLCFEFGGFDQCDERLRRSRKRAKALELTVSNSPTLADTPSTPSKPFSWRRHFKISYIIRTNWRRGGTLLGSYRLPIFSASCGSNAGGTVTSLALDRDFVAVGLANSNIKIYSAKTGVLVRTLMGHENGVWVVYLVSRGGWMERPWNAGGGSCIREERESEVGGGGLSGQISAEMRRALGLDELSDDEDVDAHRRPAEEEGYSPPPRPSFMSYSSIGWGQPNSIVVSGGCDKLLKVWDVKSGECIYTLPGHTATIRSLRTLHNAPIAVSGSRDTTLRMWDVQQGRCLRVLEGHQGSVRSLDVCGRRVVSGSYDRTCRIWDLDTGECLHVLTGHLYEIYVVAFDGFHVASGGLDTTIRVWDATTGQCVALLQGHTALVCQLQLSPSLHLLATGGSDGRVITFSLETYTPVHRIAAHDSSVTALQFDDEFLVTGGNDGRVRLWDARSGSYIRELCEVGEIVWKVAFGGGGLFGKGLGGGGREVLAVMSKRNGKTAIEIWSLGPKAAQHGNFVKGSVGEVPVQGGLATKPGESP